MWVTPNELKYSSSSFSSIFKFAALCVIVTLAVLFLQQKRGGPVEFECNEVGRFPDPNNYYKDCYRSYVLCIGVGGDSDSWKTYTCPLGTQFSALEGGCVNEKGDYDSECRNYEEHKELTEIVSQRITSNFECEKEGVFRNSDSSTCTDYFICVTPVQASLYAIYSSCEEGQFFSPQHSACIEKASHYCDQGLLRLVDPWGTSLSPLQRPSTSDGSAPPVIVASPSTTTSPPVATSSATTTVPSTTTLSSSTRTTPPSTTPSVPTTTSPPTTTPPRPISTLTTAESGENCESTEIEFIQPLLSPIPIPKIFFTCPAEGRFKSPFQNSTDCSYYILCCYVASPDLEAYLFHCPTGNIFCLIRSRCIPGTIESCKEVDKPLAVAIQTTQLIERSTTTTTTTPPPPTIPIPTTSHSIYEPTADPPWIINNHCKGTGRFHTEFTLNCRSYLLCPRTSSAGFYFRCPSEYPKFSEVVGRCVKDYDCPYYFCTRPGRFPYVRDKEKYVLCIPSNGRLVAHRMSCAEDMVFSNIRRRCVPEKLVKLTAWK